MRWIWIFVENAQSSIAYSVYPGPHNFLQRLYVDSCIDSSPAMSCTYSYGSPHMAAQKQDDQHERTFSSYVRIQVVVLKTCLGRWTIGRSGERGSGISVLPARYDDDDDDVLTLKSSEKKWRGMTSPTLLTTPKTITEHLDFSLRKEIIYMYIYIYWK